MTLYNFKYKSKLNTGFARILNAVILSILLLLWNVSTFHWEIKAIDGSVLTGLILYVVISTPLGLSVIFGKNKWMEVDKREAQNKESFILTYSLLSTLFAILIAITLALTIRCYGHGGQGLWVRLAILSYLMFNKVNICSLFNFNGFFDKLLPQYDCTEIDVIKHVLSRDHMIELDEMIWRLRQYREKEKREV